MESLSGAETVAVVASLSQKSVALRKQRECYKQDLTAECQKKQDELHSDENLIEENSAAVTKIITCIDHIKILDGSVELTFQGHNAESTNLRNEIDGATAATHKLRESFQKRTLELGLQFTSAPNNYAVDKMVNEMEMNNKAFDNFREEINMEWNPIIETSNKLMQNEPCIILDSPDSSTAEVTIDVIEALDAALNETSMNQMIEKLKQEDINLDKEVDTI